MESDAKRQRPTDPDFEIGPPTPGSAPSTSAVIRPPDSMAPEDERPAKASRVEIDELMLDIMLLDSGEKFGPPAARHLRGVLASPSCPDGENCRITTWLVVGPYYYEPRWYSLGLRFR